MLAGLVLLFPVGFTTAYLTAETDEATTSGGTGRWCSVPDPEKQPNVYRLNEFPTIKWAGSETSRMIIVPVVNNGEFGPSEGNRRLGVRAWSCKSDTLTAAGSVKVTTWRNASSKQTTMNWSSDGSDRFASQRLNPKSSFGEILTNLHRHGTKGGAINGNDRQRYSWVMSSGQTKSSKTPPTCSNSSCSIALDPNPTFATGFQADAAGTREPKNSVEYLASGYWTGAGTFDRSSAHPVNLAPYSGTKPPFANGTGPSSTDGRQVQWVVMEWWGSTTPSDDMVLEVFVR